MNTDKNIRLIGLDLDGTLLSDDKKFCPGAEEILKKAQDKGIYLVPITGRPFKGVPGLIRESGLFEYIISSNGAQITERKSGRALYSFTIPNEKCNKIIKILRSFDLMFEPFADGVGYSQQYIFDYCMEMFGGSVLEEYFTSSRVIENDIEGLFENTSRRADEFFVECADREMREALIERLTALGELQFCILSERFLEVTASDCDKGNALETLCNHLGVPIESTLAFGDGENDLTLLEKAGISVAMGNAFPVVKEKADIIADTNNNNGVCKIIEKYINF